MNAFRSADEVRTSVRFPEDVARAFVEWQHACVQESGRFSVALAGGSTPRGVYEALAAAPFDADVSWARLEIFMGDERCVPPDHADSNWRMATEALLNRVPVNADKLHRLQAERDNLEAAAADYEAEMRAILGDPPALDLVLLGVGFDGHTASLFPDTEALRERERLVVANPVPQLSTTRMTLTYPALKQARQVWFLVTGEKKGGVVREIFRRGTESGYPAALVHPVQGKVVWFLDESMSAAVEAVQ